MLKSNSAIYLMYPFSNLNRRYTSISDHSPAGQSNPAYSVQRKQRRSCFLIALPWENGTDPFDGCNANRNSYIFSCIHKAYWLQPRQRHQVVFRLGHHCHDLLHNCSLPLVLGSHCWKGPLRLLFRERLFPHIHCTAMYCNGLYVGHLGCNAALGLYLCHEICSWSSFSY